MLKEQIFWGTILITGCAIFHVMALLLLAKILKLLNTLLQRVIDTIKHLIMITLAIIYVISIHTIEIIFWALTYVKIGEFEHLEQAIYFSTVTATTLGYGDVVLSEQAQLLSGFEAIGGLILFSVSTAFFIKLITVLFEPDKRLE